MNIIQLLKKNEKQLILMNSELRESMLSMNHADFLCLQGTSAIDNLRWLPNTSDKWYVAENLYSVFRLRADYTEQPEIEEVGIYDEGNERYFLDSGEPCRIHTAPASVHCVGFRFEDGGWYDAPIKPVGPDGKLWSGNITVDDIVSGRVKIIHASHVLFRGQE